MFDDEKEQKKKKTSTLYILVHLPPMERKIKKRHVCNAIFMLKFYILFDTAINLSSLVNVCVWQQSM